MTTPADLMARLERDGYAVVPGVLDPDSVAAKRAALAPFLAAAPFGRNSFVGRRTRRIFCVLAKTREFDDAVLHPLFLGAAEALLGPHQLSVANTAIEIHPGEPAQTLHADDGKYPLPTSAGPLVVNTMWALDDFTADNGATRLIPGSHHWPDKKLSGAHETAAAEMAAGSVLVYLGSLLHGGGANVSPAPRLGVVIELCAGWLRPQENLGLCYPPDLARTMPPGLQALVGYRLYPPFLGYVDGEDPARLL